MAVGQALPTARAGASRSEIGDGALSGRAGAWIVGALFAFALVLGAYFTFRFGGRWSEADSATFVIAIRAIVREATLTPAAGEYYPNGYVFSAISSFLMAFTGLEASTLVQLVYPLVSASLVLPAWVLYREVTGSVRAATLATLLLFSQPEFVFVILRGSHERMLRILLFTSLFLLVRSLRFVDRPGAYTAYVAAFYLTVYGVIATNSLFGSSYVWALTLALIWSWAAAFLGPALAHVSNPTRRRLVFAPIVCILFVVVFNSYIYPSAGNSASQVSDIFDRLYRLFLTTSPDPSTSAVVEYDPYAAVVSQWIDLRIYFLLSVGTYLLILGSGIAWARTGLRWLAGSDRPTLGEWVLWLCYGVFALQSALSIVADRAGVLGGNLQHRTFPSFIMVAAPLLASTLVRLNLSKRIRTGGAAMIGVLTLFAIVKATNEPIVSNKWTFYLPSEIAAVAFTAERQVDTLWWDVDERMTSAQLMAQTKRADGYGAPSVSSATRTIMITDVVRLRAARLERPLPPVGGEMRVYDNGEAQIYRLRPRTAFQH